MNVIGGGSTQCQLVTDSPTAPNLKRPSTQGFDSFDCQSIPAKRPATDEADMYTVSMMTNELSEVVEKISVPENVVGLVIGKSGSEIQRIQLTSGCKVQMDADGKGVGGFRGCSLQGNQSAIELAKEMIKELLSRQSNRSSGAGGMGLAPMGSEQTIDVLVSAEKCGLIIGKGGETIRQLQEQSGCKMQMIQDSQAVTGQPKPLRVTGTPQNLETAKILIQNVLENEKLTHSQGMNRTMQSGNVVARGEIVVPRSSVGVIIGKGGEMIKRLAMETGTKIQFKQDDDPNSPERCAVIMGTREQIYAATEKITELVARNGENQSNAPIEIFYMHIPANKTGLVIGKGGETIKQINNDTGAFCELSKEAPPNVNEKVFLIKGTPYQIHQATHCIRIKVGDIPPNTPVPAFMGRNDFQQPHLQQAGQIQYQQPQMATGGYAPYNQQPQQSMQQMSGGMQYGASQQPQQSYQPVDAYQSPLQPQSVPQQQPMQMQPVQQPQMALSAPSTVAPTINPTTGQPDYSAQWAEYYRSVGLHAQAAMVESHMKQSQTPRVVGSAVVGLGQPQQQQQPPVAQMSLQQSMQQAGGGYTSSAPGQQPMADASGNVHHHYQPSVGQSQY